MRNTTTTRNGNRRLAAPVVALLLGLLLGAAPDARGQEIDEKLDGARAALEQWVQTRRLISQEKRDLALARETIQARIDLVRREIASLRERIADAEKSIGEAESKQTELAAERDVLKEASTMLAERVTELERRTLTLMKRLPEPSRERVQPLSRRIPENPEDTKASLGERFQNVVGLLNDVNKFNREITVTSEVRSLGDGSSAEVTAIYLGIGQGYYVGAGGKAAGVGTAEGGSWTWTPTDDAADRIARAARILANEEPAAYVPLPIRIR